MGRDFRFVFVASGTPERNQDQDSDFVSLDNNQCDWGHTVSRHNDEIPSGRYTKFDLAMYITELAAKISSITAQNAIEELLGGDSMWDYDPKNADDLAMITKVLNICEKCDIDYSVAQCNEGREMFMLKSFVHGDVTEIASAISVASRALGEIPAGMEIIISYN